MVIFQKRSKRKPSGGRYKSALNNKLCLSGNNPSLTKLGPKKTRKVSTYGGALKVKQLAAETANLFDVKTGKYVSAKIVNIKENPANRHFVRRNIMTKGSIIETDKGVARITNRPGQEGTVNAVLI